MKLDDIYVELDEIKKTDWKRMTLVKSEINQLLYVKKEYNDDCYELYQQIKNMNSHYFPKIEIVEKNQQKTIIIEQYINALTLDVYLFNHHISQKEARHIFIQICYAVKSLHDSKPPIIHRDIKPENIFIDQDRIYLFDFDIARHFDDTKRQDTRILGSVGYASPEQFGFQQSDQRSDIYALGVLLNFIFTKKMPNVYLYQGKEKKIIEKAIKIDPEQRYQNIDELLCDFIQSSQQNKIINDIYQIPGFRNSSLIRKGLALIGYILLAVICFFITVEGEPFYGIVTWLYRIVVFIMFLAIVFLIGNYQNIQSKCLFSSSQNKLIKYFGMFLSYCMFVFSEIIILAIILQFIL